ncbi:hypothetical protein KM043_010953 [Ampulex compressa]|nr:hypothetical protein KM043_010953 [Ampulex compressa]
MRLGTAQSESAGCRGGGGTGRAGARGRGGLAKGRRRGGKISESTMEKEGGGRELVGHVAQPPWRKHRGQQHVLRFGQKITLISDHNRSTMDTGDDDCPRLGALKEIGWWFPDPG